MLQNNMAAPKRIDNALTKTTLDLLRKRMVQDSTNNANNKGPVSSMDSLKHQIGKMMEFEKIMGGYDPVGDTARGLPNYGYNQSQLPYNKKNPNWKPPTNKKEAVDMYIKELGNKLDYYPSSMEKAEAADFMYNTGRDPRVYMIDAYLKKQGGVGVANRPRYNVDNKTEKWTPDLQKEVDDLWNAHKKDLMKLSVNDRRLLMNEGRDSYYQSLNRVNGQPNPMYKATWAPRLWYSVNDY
jgi:hypothetical protein